MVKGGDCHPAGAPPQAERVIASVHLAMFDAVNSIEPRYRPYRLAVITTKDASPEAAAAVAAGAAVGTAEPGVAAASGTSWPGAT